MKKLLKNRVFAVLVCILAIVGSIYANSRHELSELVDDVELQFIEGTDGSGQSIYTDLQSRVGLARNLTAVASRYLDADDKELKAVKDAADDLEGETRPGKAYDANVDLELAVQTLNMRLMELGLSETDESYRSGIITDLASYAHTISSDEYNQYARELNEDTLAAFPANFLKLATFVGSAELFN